jgi:pimeloyl-ACP methyl ester carboxylesterase
VVAVVVAALVLQFVLLPVALAVYATNAPRPERGTRTPADVGLAAEDVILRSEDGTRLAAWYVPSRNGAAIVLLHGSGSTRDDLLDHAAMLARHGYGVLLLDARGHGGSAGEPMELGWGGERDVRAAVDHLVARIDVDPERIGVLGQSMGGEVALTAAAADGRIRAVVSEGAEVVTIADAAERPETVGGWPSIPILWVETIVADLLSDASPPPAHSASVAAIAPRPVLLIAGESAAEAASNRFFAETGGPTVDLWVLPDTPHVSGLRVHPAEYEQRVVAFFDAALA